MRVRARVALGPSSVSSRCKLENGEEENRFVERRLKYTKKAVEMAN